MKRAEQLYAWLERGPSPVCDEIISAGLADADGETLERLCELLLTREHDASWAGLIGIYDRLTPERQARVRGGGERVRSGIAQALRAEIAEVRLNALAVLDACPSPSLAYALSSLLRDKSGRVRDAAARTFRNLGEIVLEADARTADAPRDETPAGKAKARAAAVERTEFLRALIEVVRTFELHNRPEVLEVSLWFARELGPPLWKLLDNHRARCGRAVAENLVSWRSPKLTGFLLDCLQQHEWRIPAITLLRTWKTLPELVALLRCSSFMDDAEQRRSLLAIKSPPCFMGLDRDLLRVPASLRTSVPPWVCALGYTQQERTTLLTCWANSKMPDVHLAAIEALASIGNASAKKMLSEHEARQKKADEPGSPAAERNPSADDAFDVLWRQWRAQGAADDSRALRVLRDNARVWRQRWQQMSRSTDANDRLALVRAIGTPALATEFAAEIESLTSDSNERVRRAAAEARKLVTGRGATGAPPPPADAPESPRAAEIRQKLATLLAEHAGDDAAGGHDAYLVSQIGELLAALQAALDRSSPQPESSGGVR
ncbi:HEAT repeat protein [Phycisphaerae bacterium RAS1]|nr:HEAT repeat protein [Phycisphaerae bacterium RAS1]